MNSIDKILNFIVTHLQPAYIQLYNRNTVMLGKSWVAFSFTEEIHSGDCFSVNAAKNTIKIGGGVSAIRVNFHAYANPNTTATANVSARILKNNNVIVTMQGTNVGGSALSLSDSVILEVSAGDTISIDCSATAVNTGRFMQAYMSVTKIK